MRRTTRARAGQGWHVRTPGPLESRPAQELEQYAEIEHDRRLERRLVVQSLLAMLFVVVLVVVGRLLSS